MAPYSDFGSIAPPFGPPDPGNPFGLPYRTGIPLPPFCGPAACMSPLPPRPDQLERMKHHREEQEKEKPKGMLGWLVTLSVLGAVALFAWKNGVNRLVNTGLSAVKAQGFLPAVYEGGAKLVGKVRGLNRASFSKETAKAQLDEWKIRLFTPKNALPQGAVTAVSE